MRRKNLLRRQGCPREPKSNRKQKTCENLIQNILSRLQSVTYEINQSIYPSVQFLRMFDFGCCVLDVNVRKVLGKCWKVTALSLLHQSGSPMTRCPNLAILTAANVTHLTPYPICWASYA